MIRRKTQPVGPYSPTNSSTKKGKETLPSTSQVLNEPFVEVMSVDTTAGVQRVAEDTLQSRVKITRQGDQLISGFPDML